MATKIGSIYVEVRGDDTKFKKDMRELNVVAKKSGREVSDSLNSSISPKQASAGIRTITNDLTKLSKTAKVPEKQFKQTAGAITDSFKDVAKSIGMTDKEFAKLNEKMLRNKAMKQAENSLRNITKAAGLTSKETKSLAKQMGLSSNQAEKMTSSIHRLNKSTNSMASSMKMITGIFGAAGFALLAKNIIEVGMNFERTMSTVKAVTSGGVQNFAALQQAAKTMGETTEWSATQAAEALQFLGMAGLDSEQAIEALPGALNLATAGALDLGEAADLATNILSGMGLEVGQLSHLNDVLAKTVTSSNTNMIELGEAFKFVAPAAASMGVSVEEVSAMLGTLASNGVKSGIAGRNLQGILLKLDKAAEKLGMESGSSLVDVFKNISKEQWSASETAEIFGVENTKTALILARNLSSYEGFLKTLGDVDGEAKRLADTMKDNTAGAIKELQSAIEGVKIDAFTSESGNLKESIEDLTVWIRQNKDELIGLAASMVIIVQRLANAGKILGEFVAWATFTTQMKQASDASNAAWKQIEIFNEKIKETKKEIVSLKKHNRTDVENTMLEIKALRENIKNYEYQIKLRKDSIATISTEGNAINNLKQLMEAAAKKHAENIIKQNNLNKKAVEIEIKGNNEIGASIKKKSAERIKYEEKAKKNIEKIWEELFDDREKSLKQFEKEYEISQSNVFKIQQKSLDKRKKEYEDFAFDQKKIDAWYNKEKERFIDDEMNAFLDMYNKQELEHKRVEREKTLASQNFVDGFKLGLRDITDEMQTLAEAGSDFAQTLQDEFSNALGDTFFNALKGDMDDIKGIWDNFLDSMLNKLTNTVADMAVQWGIGAIGSATGWWESGAWEVKKDHVAVVHKGEMIVPADIAGTLRAEASGSQFKGSGNVSDLAKVSPNGGHEWTESDKRALQAGTRAAGTMYGLHATQGIGLYLDDMISGAQLGKGLLNPGALTSFAMAGAAEAFLEGAGMNTTNWSNWGGMAGSLGLSMLLGGGNPMVGAVVGTLGDILGSYIGMAAGDLFNARDNELVRDWYESEYGWLEGNKKYADAFSDVKTGGTIKSLFNAAFGTEKPKVSGKGYRLGQAGIEDTNSTGLISLSDANNATYWDFGGRGSTGGGGGGSRIGFSAGDMGSTSSFSFARGGIVDRLAIPNGEDGLAALQFGEGVVSKKGMENLDALNFSDPVFSYAGDRTKGDLLSELIALREEIKDLKAYSAATTRNTSDVARINERWELGGLPETRTT